MKRQRISAVDNAWLRMDRPGNLMMICGVLIFGEKIGLARLHEVIAERFLVFKRFRQRPVERPAMSFWEDDPGFDLGHHVAHTALPGRAGKRELQALVSRLASTPLDPARPRWQFHLVDNYAGASAVVVRIHHCYADGIALVRVMLSMTDATTDGPPAMPFQVREHRRARSDDTLSQVMAPLSGVLESARRIGGLLVDTGVGIWHDPAKAVDLADKGTALTAEVAKLALMAQDSPTRFKGRPGAAKRVAWAEPLPLPEVKAIGKALGSSVNDVLLSCVAGALRDYLAARGDRVEGIVLRALVPVNLRPIESAYRLGNQFGLVFLDLPIAIENPVERLYAVRANMNALKGSYQPILALGLLAAMGSGPKLLQETLLSILSRNATAVMTNVPGPRQPLYMAGARIDNLMFWVPQSGDIGMGVSIISYNESVQFGVVTDRGLCPDPERVTGRFPAQFEQLVLATLMSPWPRDGELDPQVAAAAAGIG
ncbi:MAG TPA: wax ester/triacylglycerol synthase family O-acyltransferase [Casimicrobiaceae bacterium]|nr:wax ester/triacylglycerol synthase family O-acyltransferase [Casimicrobiaceae bacterium]